MGQAKQRGSFAECKSSASSSKFFEHLDLKLSFSEHEDFCETKVIFSGQQISLRGSNREAVALLMLEFGVSCLFSFNELFKIIAPEFHHSRSDCDSDCYV